MGLGIESLAERNIRQKEAETLHVLIKGITEVLPHSECKGLYQSPECQEIAKTKKPHGCVLKYYCKLKAEGAGAKWN